MQKLTDALKATALPERQRQMLALFPETLFGFPPLHLREMLERLDCPSCQEIIDLVDEGERVRAKIQRRVDDACFPARQRNERRRRTYESRRNIPVIGWFVRRPIFEDDPDLRHEPWFIEDERRMRELNERFDSLCNQHAEHWKDGDERRISGQLIARLLGKESWSMVNP